MFDDLLGKRKSEGLKGLKIYKKKLNPVYCAVTGGYKYVENEGDICGSYDEKGYFCKKYRVTFCNQPIISCGFSNE